MKPIVKTLCKAFRAAGLRPRVGDGWLNISRPDGVNCEFYPCYSPTYEGEVYTAMYQLKGKVRDLDFELPGDEDDFVAAVCEILGHKPKKRGKK